MGASSDRCRVSLVEEVAWGVTPASPTMQIINNISEDMGFKIKTKQSANKRADRMTTDIIPTSGGSTGGFDFEFQSVASGASDPLLLAAIFAPSWKGFGAANAASLNLLGAVLTATTGVIDMSTVVGYRMEDFFPGKRIKIKAAVATNDGFYTVKTSNATTVTILPLPTANQTFAAGDLVSGLTAKNGTTKRSFTIEKYLEDINQGFVFPGMVVDEFSLKFQSEKEVNGSVSFIGKDVETGAALIGTTYTKPPSTPSMSANFNVGNVEIDGVPVADCLVDAVELNIKNNADGKTAVGTFGYCRVREGAFDLGGKFSAYLNDLTIYDRFRNNTPFAFSFTLTDNAGWTYIITMPRCKFSDDNVFAKAKNTDVMDDAKYVAIADNTTSCMIQIDRFFLAP